ncbi:MAG: hypothetical protein AAFY76_11130 [Cyanobacteria bacterium J06649_11]
MPTIRREFEDDNLYRFENSQQYPTQFDIDRRRDFCAIYYPCEVSQNSDVRNEYLNLKRALLFFDKVFVVVPEIIFSDYFCSWIDMSRIDEQLIRRTKRFNTQEYILWRERFRRLRRFIRQTKIAHDAGALVYVNPFQVMQWPSQTHFYSLPDIQKIPADKLDEHLAEIIFHSIVGDLNDHKFRSLVKQGYPYGPGGFSVFKDQGEINWLMMLSETSNYDEDRLVNLATFIDENTISPPPGVGFDSIVSPVLGMAVLVSHIMSFCIRNPVYPVTDSSFHWKLLAHKFARLAKEPAMQNISLGQKEQIGALGLEVLDLELPNLDNANFEEILEIRAKFEDELKLFRTALAEFSDFSSTQIWSNEFAQECSNIAMLKVAPALRELCATLENSRDKVVLDTFKKIRGAKATIPLVGTFLAGIPLIYALAITGGLITAEAFLELYFERKKIRKGNSLSFLLDLKGKF